MLSSKVYILVVFSACKTDCIQFAIARGAWSTLPHAELNPLQQSLLWDYAREFLYMQPNLEINEDSLKESLANARVWWFGDREDEHGELYLRVQSDRYLIELLHSNTFGVVSSDVEANHVHSSFRDLKNDR